MDAAALGIGALVLVGDHNWRRGPRRNAAMALIFGRGQRITDDRARLYVKWWRGEPYLISIRGVRA